MPMDGELDGDDMPGTAPTAPPAATEPKMVPADMLPEGAKAGDKLVLGEPGEDGMFPVTLEKGADTEKDGDMDKWAAGVREHMRPTMGEET